MCGQPFKGNDEVVIERRDAEGKLDLKGEQPPFISLKFDDVYHRMFWQDPANNDKSGSWENLEAWLKEKGWSLRKKTW